MDDGVVQQGEGVRAAPPAGGIGGVAAVSRPAVRLVLLQPVEVPHVLRIADGLKNAHVLAAGKHICALHPGVDGHDRAGHALLLIDLHGGQHAAQRRHKEAPDQRLVGDGGGRPDGDALQMDDLHGLPQKGLAVLPGGAVLQEHVQGEEVLVFGVNAVGRKAAAQTVGAVVHGAHALNDLLTGHPLPVP